MKLRLDDFFVTGVFCNYTDVKVCLSLMITKNNVAELFETEYSIL